MECFVPGTRILTPDGEIDVEALVVGDTVVTASGATRTVTWVGQRRLRLDTHPQPAKIKPIRIAAGAFAANLPARDLLLSPGHGVLVRDAGGDRLIPIGRLVNGRTIVQLDWSEVTYVHVELDRHDVMLAEGLPAESYLDCGQRADFEGQAGAMTLHPLFELSAGMVHEGACAPFEIAGPVLEATRARLARRADRMATGGRPIRLFKRRAG